MKSLFNLVLLLATVTLLACATPSAAHSDHSHMTTMPTLPELVASSSKFSILLELMKYTNIVETVSSEPNVTIFAPTNFAFRKSLRGLPCTVRTNDEAILCIKHLFGRVYTGYILIYHGVLGKFDSTAVLAKTTFDTVNGQSFMRKGMTLIDNIDPDVNPMLITNMLDLKYDNGIVHAINNVLLPLPHREADGIVKVASSAGVFNILLALLTKTGLATDVVNSAYITIFAPTDMAFKASAKEVGCKGMLNADTIAKCAFDLIGLDAVKAVLAYHIVPGMFISERVLKMRTFTSSNGSIFFRKRLTLVDQAPVRTNPTLIRSLLDVKFDKGLVHGIDRVLIPFNTEVGNACQQLEFPLSLADGSFASIVMLSKAAFKCPMMRSAIWKCSLKRTEICMTRYAMKRAYRKITVGRVAAAAKKCKLVAMAFKGCM